MTDEQGTITAVVAIRKFFFAPDAKAADVIAELKKLTAEDKRELAEGAAKALGLRLVDAPKA